MFTEAKKLVEVLKVTVGKAELNTVKAIEAEMLKIEKNLSKDEDAAVVEVKVAEAFVMGTVEPIYKDIDKLNTDVIGFVRGFITKYKSTMIPVKQVFDYLENLIK